MSKKLTPLPMLRIGAALLIIAQLVDTRTLTGSQTGSVFSHEISGKRFRLGGLSGRYRPAESSSSSPKLSPLIKAALENQLSEVARLLDEGAPLDGTDEYGRTVLHLAICNKNAGMVRLLLQEGGEELVDASSSDQNTILHYAAYAGNGEIIRLLLATNAKKWINERKTVFKQTPLHKATESPYGSDSEIICALLDAGANPNIPGGVFGSTALHEAVSNEHCTAQVVKKLLDSGALVDAKDKRGYTPLHVASDLEKTYTLLAHRVPLVENPRDLVTALLSSDSHTLSSEGTDGDLDLGFQLLDRDGEIAEVSKKSSQEKSALYAEAPLLGDILDLARTELETMQDTKRRIREILNIKCARSQTALERATEEYARRPNPHSSGLDSHGKFPWQRKIKEKRDFLSALHEELERDEKDEARKS